MPTPRQIKAAKELSETIRSGKPKTMGKILEKAGYAKSTTKRPTQVTKSKSWPELMEQFLPDKKLAEVHESLLNAHFLDNMVFPKSVPDEEIKELLNSTGCKLRKIKVSEVSGAKHAYFWAPNTKAQKDAVELAYKLKGRLVTKVDGTLKGELNIALVEFVGDDTDHQDDNTDS